MMRFLRLGVGHKLGGEMDSRRTETTVALDVSDESDIDYEEDEPVRSGQDRNVSDENADEQESDLERVMQNAVAIADDEDADGWNSSGEY